MTEGGKQESDLEQIIERFRKTGLSLDRNGRFWHEGSEVVHEGFRMAMLRWIDYHDERFILRLDETRYAYVDVEDTPLLVLSLRWKENRALIKLNDKSEEELRLDTLAVARNHSVYCLVRNGSLEARITTNAYYQLTENLVETTDSSDTISMGILVGEKVYSFAARNSTFINSKRKS